MASNDSKCPICGKVTGTGLVSGLLVQHENKYGERCKGSGERPVYSSATRKAPTASRTSGAGSRARAEASAPKRGSVSVRRVEVDPERIARLEEKQRKLREERAAAARARNEFYSSGLDISDEENPSASS